MPDLPRSLAKRVGPRLEQADRVLLTKGLAGITLQVVAVLDASLSMEDLYQRGVVARAVERIAAVADRLDDDRTLQAWVFADKAKALPDLALAELDGWARQHIPRHPKDFELGIGNDEPVVMGAVCDALGIRWDDGAGASGPGAAVTPSGRPAAGRGSPPALVLFLSDGGVYEDDGIAAIVRSTADQPLCWVFVGVGDDDFGVLRDLDALRGRVVDNAGFFQVDDLDDLGDDDLYQRLLAPVAEWHRAARAQGIV